MTETTSDGELTVLSAGDYAYRLECPDCGRVATTPLQLSATLTVTSEGGTLRARITGTKAVEHMCNADGATQLQLVPEGDQ
jgi:hypothetical protein